MTIFSIERVDHHDARWPALMDLVQEAGQYEDFTYRADWYTGNHIIAARDDQQWIGFLRFITQPIGVEEAREPVVFQKKVLIEARNLVIWVKEPWRRQGVGTALRQYAFKHACQLGCYQIRSLIEGANLEHHLRKLIQGYGIPPVVCGKDQRTLWLIVPCRPGAQQEMRSNASQ